jgi:hypothetical protein
MGKNVELSVSDDSDAVIWRYMDLLKFLSLVQKRSLWFCTLAYLPNPYEGLATEPSHKEFPIDVPNPECDRTKSISLLDGMQWFAKRLQVNCWCAVPHESDALWRLYGGGASGGVAIQSRVSKLRMSLPDACLVQRVKYIDRTVECFDPALLYEYATHKSVQYQYENEVRAIRDLTEVMENVNAPGPPVPGVDVPIADMTALIDRAVISPYSPGWFCDAIVNLCQRYELTVRVEESGYRVTS